MSLFKKTYFLCPTSDFIHPPPAGPLCLGAILQSTSTPQHPLNKASIVAVDNENPPIVENDWKKTISADSARGLGVYSEFLQLVLGPELEVEHSKQIVNMFAFDQVTTVSFEPTSKYIEEAVKAPTVQAWLKQTKQRVAPVNTLFLLTGLKLVKGAKIKYTTAESKTAHGRLGIDVGTFGISYGPKGHWNRTNEDSTEFNREQEFVFAFRVVRLKIGRKVKSEAFNKGALMSISIGKDDDESVLVEDVDGSDIKAARLVPDEAEDANVYCVPG